MPTIAIMNSLQTSLRQQQHPLIRQLADAIETIWQGDLAITPYTIPADLGYIENQLEGETLIIENHCYQAPQFRKMHLELAQVGSGLDILHCVMFPNPEYPLPMFGCDIIGARGNISAAIVDLSPIRADRRLPEAYDQALSQLPESSFSQPRELPAWGSIFSSFCTFVRPADDAENQQFLKRVQHMLQAHCRIANQTQPVTSEVERQQILAGQAHYCTQQRQNDKTRRVLEKAFGTEWAERYMNTMLFDLAAV